MNDLQQTSATARPFLDWAVVTDPAGCQADVERILSAAAKLPQRLPAAYLGRFRPSG